MTATKTKYRCTAWRRCREKNYPALVSLHGECPHRTPHEVNAQAVCLKWHSCVFWSKNVRCEQAKKGKGEGGES